MNSAYRDLILANVQAAVGAAKAVKGIKHKGLKGQLREIVIRDLFRPFLPADVGVGTGKIITADNRQSSQQDVVIFDRSILPPILFESHIGLFPIESVLYTVEVKSTLTLNGLKSSHKSATELLGFQYQAGIFDEQNRQINHTVAKAVSTILAFDTNLAAESKSEVERYDELRGQEYPAISAICVVGRGYWYRYSEDRWENWQRACELDEVLGFISGVMNTYRKVAATRKEPHLGRYLVQG